MCSINQKKLDKSFNIYNQNIFYKERSLEDIEFNMQMEQLTGVFSFPN